MHQAKTTLSKLLKLVEDGQEVEIRRGSVPVARLVAAPGATGRRGLVGSLPDPGFWMSDDFDAPMPGPA